VLGGIKGGREEGHRRWGGEKEEVHLAERGGMVCQKAETQTCLRLGDNRRKDGGSVGPVLHRQKKILLGPTTPPPGAQPAHAPLKRYEKVLGLGFGAKGGERLKRKIYREGNRSGAAGQKTEARGKTRGEPNNPNSRRRWEDEARRKSKKKEKQL